MDPFDPIPTESNTSLRSVPRALGFNAFGVTTLENCGKKSLTASLSGAEIRNFNARRSALTTFQTRIWRTIACPSSIRALHSRQGLPRPLSILPGML
jgi:hypothetical protein